MQMQYDEDESGKMRSGLDIAVIGAVGRFPGADNIEEFWDNLKNGVESITFFSDRELLAAGVSAAELEQPGYVKAKGYMTDIEYFDAGFFGYSPQEAEKLDPQTRILHECVWHLLEQSGYDPYTYDGAVGCFLGARNNTPWQLKVYLSCKGDAAETFDLYNLSDKDQISTRISYKLNLTGPSFQLVTQCSTSLVVVHEACRSLIHGECDMAAAGGISVTMPLEHGYLYQEGMLHSRDGHLRAFDGAASGTVFGNGAGVVLLKPVEQAIADNDHIMAVIKSTFINNDGSRKVGYTAPSVEGQAEAIKTALELADVEPESIGYIEAHGTATSIGDIIEIDALTLAFNTTKRHFCRIGTVKTNIGHLGISAGIAGFIKTVLALKHRLIPPCLHIETPNPRIDFENSPFLVNRELHHWRPGRDRLRAGVSAFGVGGTNVHVILEEWPIVQSAKHMAQSEGREEVPGQGRGEVPSPSREHQLILLSAKTPTALDKMAENLAGYFKENLSNRDNHENPANPGLTLADAAYTLQVGRAGFPLRLAFVCADIGEAAAVLGDHRGYKTFTNHSASPPAIIFMFPGQGAQYVNMGWDLYCTQPVFREEMDRCFEILKPIMNHDIKEILYPGGLVSKVSEVSEESSPDSNQHNRSDRSNTSNKSYKSHIDQTEIAQPLLFSFEYALARLLMSWGIRPFALIGHSVGEYTAACLSGVFSLDHGLALVAARGQLMQKLPTGAMLGVPLPAAEVKPLLSGNISLAAVNTPSRCVVSGAAAEIEAFHRFLAARGHRCTRLHTSHAFHSPMMDPVLTEFQMKVENVVPHPPGLPYISNITGDWVKESEAVSPGYWVNHLRETVQFARGMETLEAGEMESAIFIEVGPGNVLGTFARQCFPAGKERFVINPVRHPRKKAADDEYLLNQLVEYWLYNGDLDWQGFHRGEQRRRIPLPVYPFQRRRYWIDEDPLGEYGLPGTALPAGIKKTNGLPGKITNLPGERQGKKKKSQSKPRPNLTVPYTPPAPGDKTAETLVDTWKNYFGFDQVGIHDDFFQLGGDSLKAVTIMALMQKAMQVEIPAGEFFQRPTPAELADYINHHAVKGKYIEVPAGEKKEYYELSPVQGRMYVLQRMQEENITYNEFFALRVEGELNKDRVEGTFLKLIQQHESFRTCFRLHKGGPVQKIIPYDEIDFAVEYFPVEGRAGEDKAGAVDRVTRDFIRSFDLAEAPLIRTALIKTGPEAHIFAVDMHHIITDGTSHGILIENFLDLYHDGEVTARRTRYKDFSRWRNRVLRSGGMKEQENYWLKEFADEAPVLNLPLDYPRPGFLTFAGTRVKDRLESSEATALRRLAAAREATLFMALLAAFNVFLYRLSGQEDIVCGTVIAGRQRAEFQDIIGMFVNTLALRNYPHPGQPFSQFLRILAKNALMAYENQDYPLDALVEKTVKHRVPGRNPLFDVTFALLNVEIPAVQVGGLQVTPYECENITAKFDLSFMVVEVDDYLVLNVEYNTGLFKKETVKRFIGFYKRVVASILECPEQEIAGIEIMGAEERARLLLEFNNTAGEFPREQTLHRVFAHQVRRWPGHTAVSHCLDLTAVYDELESAQFNEDCRDRLEKCCFSVNPHVFQFAGNRFLKALGLFDEAELGELVLVKTHRENYAAVNRPVLRLLASLEGRTNLKSMLPALVNKNMEFRVYHVVIDRETGQLQGKPGKFPVTGTADMILLFKSLYRANLIELEDYKDYHGEMEPWDLAAEGEEKLWPPPTDDSKKQGAREQSKEVLTGPVLLLGDRAAAASTGLLYMASFLRRHGIEAYCQWNNLSKTGVSLKENIQSLLAGIQPRVVGVSMKWFPHIARVLEICKIVKNYNPLIRVVVGGNTAAYYKDKIIQHDDIDYVVKGDGEVPFLKICRREEDIPNCLYKKNGKIVETPIDYVQNEENSAEVYLSHLEEIFVSPLDPYLAPGFYINTGKGCSQQCFYCAGCREVQEKIFNRRKPFLRGVEEVRKDIAAAKIYTGCFMFDFDLPLYDSLDYYKKIWAGLNLSGYFCKFYFWLLPGGEFIDLVAGTFKYVYINIDLCSLSESHRRGLASRGLVKPQPGDDELFDFFARCEKYSNISVIINHITGLPYFSYEDIKISEGVITRLMEYRCFQGMDWGRLHAQPGAPIAADPGKYGMFSYAETYEDFLHHSQLNLQEDIYPELFNFHYPYIYFNDNKLNSAITRFYAEAEQKVQEQGKKKRRNLKLVNSLTYEKLDRKSNRLARVLQERGVFAESIVGLCLECSLEMMVGLLAILKAGGAYLPLAVNLPVQRALYMLNDCRAGVLLTQESLAGSFVANGFPGEVINISGKELYMNREDGELPETAAPGGAAYIIYTSGSTGQPKGVVVEHSNVLRLVKNSNYIDMSRGDKLLLTGAFGFDITTFEIWGSLLNGVRLFWAHQDTILDEVRLGEILRENKISILHLIPQLFNRLADRAPGIFAGPRYLLVGGDLVSPVYVNKIRNRYPALKILHMYGPTENTTFSTFFPVEKDYKTTIPIGSPIKNSTVYIVNAAGGFQPLGVVGEIVVGGEGIARGYLNNPGLTAQKFINYKLQIPNYKQSTCLKKRQVPYDKSQITNKVVPCGRVLNAFGEREAHELRELPPIETTFNEKLLRGGPDASRGGFLEKSPVKHLARRRQRIYKTGDLGRWLADGTIEFLGRKDGQVKVRGFRIEPEEIEVCLLSHPAIKQAVVLLTEKEDRDRYLCAYIVSGVWFNVTELREYLVGRLPDYMIPADFFQVDRVPLTTNGKVDRRALAGLAKKLAPGAEYAAPRSDKESLMADIWKEVLQVEEVGIYDNFFDLGGTSMDIVRVHSRLKEAMDKNISIVSLYRYTTIDAFSRFMGSEEAGDHETPGGDGEREDMIRRGKAEKVRMREKRMRRSQ